MMNVWITIYIESPHACSDTSQISKLCAANVLS